nr:DUF687 family protein [Chlamydia buteonis]
MGLEISESCRYNATGNTTIAIIPNDQTNFCGEFTNGRAYAISHATHTVFSFLAMINIYCVISSNNAENS